MSQDFSTWTRADFQAFDARRQEVFQPTQEELATQQHEIVLARQATIASKLQAIGVAKPDALTKEFVIGMLQQLNAQQFVGEDLEGWVDNQIILFGDLETAFDDLVIRFL